MANRGPFEHVEINRVPKSTFNLSYSKKLTCDMGQIIPIYIQKCVPSDFFQVGNEVVCRFVNPLVGPMFNQINLAVYYFFCSYRRMAELADSGTFDFESFITGGEDGADAQTFPTWTCGDVASGS